jgi:hypothetical protein
MTTGASPKNSEARAVTGLARLMTDDYDINEKTTLRLKQCKKRMRWVKNRGGF